MVYTVMATRGPGDAQDALYPSVDAKFTIVEEDRDGIAPVWHAASAVRVDESAGSTETPTGAVGSSFAMTDARVLIRASTGTKKSEVEVGHVRYPWIQEVGYHQSTGVDDPGVVQFTVHLRGDDDVIVRRSVSLEVGKSGDPRAIALQAAVKIADYRLATTPNLSDDKRWTLAKLRTPKPPVREEAQLTLIRLPGSVHVSADTAIPVTVG
ncbi:hypothetical protein N1027_19090 [Herbiconiux sp. CPCC 205763]|uniref:Uncharacterized protein n=1 Tax=Herbiconiux aconitum TaxID=2970913 RepID=A0ABT2GVJ0_9MICO|nr:hypothetical protein [Herbiconiux aconitum]MCS5720236.1 hypothetical protein [Herbiconiux aconitum]